MKLHRGGVTIEREVRPAGPGLAGLHQRFSGTGERVIVTHDASLVASVRVVRGRVWFGDREAPAAFVMSVPPRSTVRIAFEAALAESDGLGRIGAFEGPPAGSPALEACPDAGVAPELVAARRALHEHLSDLAPVRAAAAAAGMTAGNLTRAFERTWGLTPKRYCTKARLFDAAIALFTGTSIASAALASGFNDLSRFYAQFRRLLSATPGQYARAAENRQDGAVGPA